MDQQVLTTQKTRTVALQFLPEGESDAAWERKLSSLVAAADDDAEMNPALWKELSSQVRPS